MTSSNVTLTKDQVLIKAAKKLCSKGLYIDALNVAESEWGPIVSWSEKQQLLLAIRLYMNLGADRKSDAIMLKLWRQNKTDPELISKMMFYKINKFGPILAAEFVAEHEKYFAADNPFQGDLLTFKAIIHRNYKNYYDAEKCLNQAIEIDPEDGFIKSQKIQLLFAQDLVNEAQTQAELLFNTLGSPYHLRVLSNIVTKSSGLDASIKLYAEHATKFQSAFVWLEYARLLGNAYQWPECEKAIEQQQKLRIAKDKDDETLIRALQGQIAIHYQDLPLAKELLSGLKSGYWKIVVENLAKSNGQLQQKRLDVPFLRQQHMTCAPTTLAAIAKFWGIDFDSKKIADQICFDGTPDTKERQWLRDNDFAFAEFELEADLAYSLIDHDIPFALVTTNGFTSHIQAVIGYNKQVGTIYIMDPSSSVMQEMLIKETIISEAFSGARCLAFVPKAKSALLDAFSFAASELYPICDEISLAIENNDIKTAKLALNSLITVAPEHRLTLIMQRRYAAWNNDLFAILELNNKLLARFPDETVLLNSKYFCLRDLGQKEDALNLLIDYLKDNNNLDLLGTLFDEIGKSNEHQALAKELLFKLKLYGSYHSPSHWSIASYLWSHKDYTKATEHYLLAHCLDETNNFYIESYFKAARFLKQQDLALQFLLNRFEKYKYRSAVPVMSLFNAYEFLNLEHLGVDYLFEALSIHNTDGNLFRYVAEKLIDNGLFEKFDSIVGDIESSLNSTDYQELLAKKAIKVGDIDRAIDFYKNSFAETPFVSNIAHSYFQLLFQTGDVEGLNDVLSELYQTHPNNSLIFEYIADWHNDLLFKDKIISEWIEGRPSYSYARRQLIDVKIGLGLFQQAVELTQQTCALVKGDMTNMSYLAKSYLKNGDFIKAKEQARKVLSIDVDNNLAFDVLLKACVSDEEKQQALNFIFEQIQTQTIFGDSAWNYWFAAKVSLGQASLKAFIEYMLKHYSHLWYAYSLAGSYHQHFGDLDAAQNELIKGRDKFPLTPRVHFDLAQLYELQGDTQQAILAFNSALEINPAWTEVAKRLADLYERENDLVAAANVLRKIVKHVVDDGVLYGYLANIEIKQEQPEKALQSLIKSVEHSQDYRWAWNNLVTVCEQLDKAEFPQQQALKLAQLKPYKAHVWRDVAYLTEEHLKKKSLLDKALSCDRHFVPAFKDLAQMYIDQGDYKTAIAVLSNTPWLDDLPFELGILKAELFAEIGQYQDAASRMEKILFSREGYAYLWTKLYKWLEKIGDKDRYIACCYQQVSTNPHEAEALCFVGENLLQHGTAIDQEKADEYLKRAYELSPNDQYIVLTYADRLVAIEQPQAALNVLNLYTEYYEDEYVNARRVEVLTKLGEIDPALSLFSQMIADKIENYWCLNKAYNALSKSFSFEKLIAIFEQNFESLTRLQAYFWSEVYMQQFPKDGAKKVMQRLEKIAHSPAWVGMLISLLEYWCDKEIVPPEKLIAKHLDYIVETPALVEQLCNAYVNKGLFQQVIDLFAKIKDPQRLAAFCFYHYRTALQMADKWDQASPVIQQGLTLKPDNTLHNMRLWYAYDLYRTGQTLDYADLDVIDYEELIENEKYVYSTLQVALALGQDSFESKLDVITPLLRKCQQDYQATVGQKLAVHAKQLLKTKLKDSIQVTGFFATLKLVWQLSNRF
ncbi:tetratricopeptide repeat protein [Paraglaciecola sp. L3A3]|uniref:tetratricopeptide repeat protein n=1 Tax=Paraglaciecola sp. L3A3 TaxID=2686358 RepID=UPI00131BB957|nr:tetratricopeptide repeat protein [Paraglaciecola sp. L3A3]